MTKTADRTSDPEFDKTSGCRDFGCLRISYQSPDSMECSLSTNFFEPIVLTTKDPNNTRICDQDVEKIWVVKLIDKMYQLIKCLVVPLDRKSRDTLLTPVPKRNTQVLPREGNATCTKSLAAFVHPWTSLCFFICQLYG